MKINLYSHKNTSLVDWLQLQQQKMGRKRKLGFEDSPPQKSTDRIQNQYYAIDEILGEKVENGKAMYLVSWKGYPSVFNSWVFKETVKPLKELLLEEKRLSAKKKKEHEGNDKDGHHGKISDLKKREVKKQLHKGRKRIHKDLVKPKRLKKRAQNEVIVIQSSQSCENPPSSCPSNISNPDQIQTKNLKKQKISTPHQNTTDQEESLEKNLVLPESAKREERTRKKYQRNKLESSGFKLTDNQNKKQLDEFYEKKIEQECKKMQEREKRLEEKKKNSPKPEQRSQNNSCSLDATLQNPLHLETGFFLKDSFLNLGNNCKNNTFYQSPELIENIKPAQPRKQETSLQQLANFFDDYDQEPQKSSSIVKQSKKDKQKQHQYYCMCDKCVQKALKDGKSTQEHDLNDSLRKMDSDDTPFQNIIKKLEKYGEIHCKEAQNLWQ